MLGGIQVADDMFQWQPLVNMAMNPAFRKP